MHLTWLRRQVFCHVYFLIIKKATAGIRGGCITSTHRADVAGGGHAGLPPPLPPAPSPQSRHRRRLPGPQKQGGCHGPARDRKMPGRGRAHGPSAGGASAGGASARPGGEASRPGPLPKHEEPKPPGLLKTCFQIIHVVKRKHKPRQPQRRPRGRKKLRGHGQEVRRRTEQASPAPRQEQERRDSASQGRAGSSRGKDNSRT